MSILFWVFLLAYIASGFMDLVVKKDPASKREPLIKKAPHVLAALALFILGKTIYGLPFGL